MNKEQWIACIRQACEESDTYRPAFDAMIATLADIMTLRDKALAELVGSEETCTTVKTSDRGAKNLATNPRLQVVMDLNRLALSYWKELLLKPKAKQIRAGGKTIADLISEMEKE